MRYGVATVRRHRHQRGTSLIEILVSLLILLVALLGLTGLMVQSQNSQLESYQRVQALTLAQDMVSRINANGVAAYCYYLTPSTAPASGHLGTNDGLTSSTLPTACPAVPVTIPVTAVASAAQQAQALRDLAEWRALLLGSAEKDAGGSQIGAVLGARGCITPVAGQTNEYQISVAWLGSSATYAPPAGIACGSGLYGADTQRRAVSLMVHITPK